MTQRGATVGSVGITTFCRSRSTLREAFSNLVRNRCQSGVVSRISTRHDPRARARVGFAAVQYLVDGAEFLRESGRVHVPAFRSRLRPPCHRCCSSHPLAHSPTHASPPQLAVKDLL